MINTLRHTAQISTQNYQDLSNANFFFKVVGTTFMI